MPRFFRPAEYRGQCGADAGRPETLCGLGGRAGVKEPGDSGSEGLHHHCGRQSHAPPPYLGVLNSRPVLLPSVTRGTYPM